MTAITGDLIIIIIIIIIIINYSVKAVQHQMGIMALLQSINHISTLPIFPVKPGFVGWQPNRCSTAKSVKQFCNIQNCWTGYRFVVRQSLRCMFKAPPCALKHFTTLGSSVDRDVNVCSVGWNWLRWGYLPNKNVIDWLIDILSSQISVKRRVYGLVLKVPIASQFWPLMGGCSTAQGQPCWRLCFQISCLFWLHREFDHLCPSAKYESAGRVGS